MDLEARISRLERSVKRWRVMAAALLLIAAAGAWQHTAGDLQGRSLKIVGVDGKPALTIATGKKGATISIGSENSKTKLAIDSVGLMVHRGGKPIIMFGDSGDERGGIASTFTPDGTPTWSNRHSDRIQDSEPQ